MITTHPFLQIVRLFLLVPVFCLLYCNCRKSQQEQLAFLSQQIKEGRGEAAIEEIIEEIEELLAESNRQHSVVLETSSEKRYVGVSPDGNQFAWIQSDQLHYGIGEQRKKISLPGKARGFNLSWSGNYAVVVLQSGEGCNPLVISMARGQLLDQQLPSIDCQHRPVITDDGQYFYYQKKGGISYYPVSQNETTNYSDETELPQELTAKNFPVRYKKVPQRFVLYQIGKHGLKIFHGNFGYYKIYFYPGSGSKLQKSKLVFSRPVLYYSHDSWYSELKNGLQATDDEGRDKIAAQVADKTAEEMANKVAEEAVDRAAAGRRRQAFVYSGKAGQWQLRSVGLDGKLTIGRSIEGDIIADNLVFLQDQNRFLLLYQDQLYYWNPLTNRRTLLPLAARFFEFYAGGLIYVDLLNRMYLRRAPFSAFEMRLVELQREALSLLER